MAYRWRWAILIVWGAALLLSLPVLPRVAGSLKVGGFSSPNTEAARAREVLQRELGFAPSTLLVVYQSDDAESRRPGVPGGDRPVAGRGAGAARASPGSFCPLPIPSLISDDGDTAYAIAGLSAEPEEAQRLVPEFEAALVPQDEVRISVTGAGASYRDIETASQRDLRRAEVIVFPIALVALLLVFGSVVAALMPLAIGAAGVALVLVSILRRDAGDRPLDFRAQPGDDARSRSIGRLLAVRHLALPRGAGQEWRQRAAGGGADGRHGGQSGLLLRRHGLDRVDGSGAVRVHVPALGRHRRGHRRGLVDRGRADAPAGVALRGGDQDRPLRHPASPRRHQPRDGFWVRLSLAVMARPVAVLIPTLALLLLLGSPFLRVNISSPDATILPPDLPSRQAFDILAAEFGAGEISPFLIVLQSDSPGDIYSTRASRLDLRRWRAAGQ